MHDEHGCTFFEQHGYMSAMLSKSQFSRRLSGIPESVWRGLIQEACHAVSRHEFIENLSRGQLSCSCLPEHPHTVLRNISGRMLPGTCFKPEGIFYGLKVYALMTGSGIPAELFLSPRPYPDANSLYEFFSPAQSGSAVYGDKECNAYAVEDELEQPGIHLNPVRKKNSKRKCESFAGDGKNTSNRHSASSRKDFQCIFVLSPRMALN